MILISAVTLAVGVRLLLVARRTRKLPELLFGIAFLTGAVGSAGGQVGRRLLWAEPGAFSTVMTGFCFALLLVGSAVLFVSTWRIFRPDRGWAAGGCMLGSLLLAASFVLRLAGGEFATNDMETRGMGLFFATRGAGFAWAAAEALRYQALLRRRLALGLAEPVVANQILLWGVSGVAAVGLSLVISISIFGLHRHPFDVPAVMALLTVFAVVTAVAMWCAFFPPAALRRIIESRAADSL